MADGLGFEPRQADPESAVLPLHNPSTFRRKVDAEAALRNATKRSILAAEAQLSFYMPF
jgi:hypothetical protein